MNVINLSGEIGWDIIPANVKKELFAFNGQDVETHIASPGGFVFDGIELFNAYRDYKRQFPNAQMMLTIKGLAASMASYFAMNPAFDLVAAEDNAVFMIHNAWMGVIGDYQDLEKAAEILYGLDNMLNSAYSKKTGKSKEEIKKLMDAETWYFGSEIKNAGFIDEIISTDNKKEKASAIIDSKIKMKALEEKLKNKEDEFEKIAAMISTHPALNAGKNNLEVVTMSLKKLLEENPAAKIEFDKEIKDSKKAGYDEGKADMIAVNKKAAVFANSKDYPEQIKGVALAVMQGEKSMETL